MKIFLPIIIVGAVIVSALFFTGLYPVALVNSQPIFFRKWRKAQEGAMHFMNAQSRAAGKKPIDFFATGYGELLRGVRRDTLTFLIEDAVLAQEGKKIVDGFGRVVEGRVREAVGGAPNLERGAKAMYGLPFDDFRELVLVPQARKDVISEAFAGGARSFDVWLREAKRKKMIQLLFVPFRWSGERVE